MDGIPFLRSQNVQPFRIDTRDVKFVSSSFHQKLKKSALTTGDVVVVRTGYPGTAALVPDSLPVANCADLVVITPGPGLDGRFLVAVFNSAWGKSTVGGRLVGVAQQHFNVTVAKEMRIPHPKIDEQRKIVSALTAYDELIENNLRRIEILEEMAQAVYRQWFVEFRFPGHEEVALVDSALGPIPERWEVLPVSDAFEIRGGATPSTKIPEYWDGGTIPWYTPSDLTSHGHLFIETSGRLITAEGLRGCSATMFPAGSVMMTSRATLGVVAINVEPACTNQGFITCLPNDRVPAALIVFWIKANFPSIENLASGATFKEITKRAFRQIDFLVPSGDVARAFIEATEPTLSLMSNLTRQIHTLRATRDLLLPRLVSGELDVSALDIDTEWLAS